MEQFFSSFNINIGVSQRLALSLIFSALYFSLILYIFEKQLKNLKIPISILSFINNRLFVAQNKSLIVSNLYFFCSYHIISFLLKQFRLILEHGKTKVFYFFRLYKVFNPLFLDLMLLSQIRYLLVVILELNGVLEVQYKEIMIIDDEQYQQE